MANILVIDDDPSVRQSLFDILSSEGHHVALAQDGETGLSLLEDAEYDVVFTDLGLPGLSGREVITAVSEHRPDTYLVVLTGWPEEIIGQALDPRKVHGILSKPFDVGRLVEMTKRIGERQAGQALG